MSLEENKALVRKMIEAFDRRDFATIDELTAPDFAELTHRYKGREAHRQFLNMHTKGFPDFHMAIEDMVAEEDNVWVRFKVTGTNRGEFHGLPPTGQKVEFTSVQMYRIVDGRFTECRAVSDSADFLRQLGVVEYTERAKKLLTENVK